MSDHPLPPTDELKAAVATIFDEVGAQSLTLKVLRTRLSAQFSMDFAPHKTLLQDMVLAKINEPATQKLLTKADKMQKEGAVCAGKGKKKATRTSSGEPATKKAKVEKVKQEKVAKDPNEPKKPLTAYFIFMASKRTEVTDEVKAANGGKADVGLIGKKLGEMWKTVSEEDKAEFQKQAAADKERYAKEMSKYVK